MEKQKEKEEKLRKKQEEKALKEEEKAKAKADKEKQKQLQKEEKEKKEKEKEEKAKTKPAEEKPIAKVNSITKFLSRAKDEGKKAAKSEPEKKDGIESVPETSTPVRPTPAENIGSNTSTPVTIKNPFTGTPYTPDPQRAQKVNLAKLKTKVTELDIEMEEAVNMKDFLKAHQIK